MKKYIKLVTISLSLILLSAVLFVTTANAQNFKTGDNITVTASEIIDSMLFAGGKNIYIAGTINGDVYCAGETVNISGTIKGDVFCAGQTINISGTVEGSIRLMSQTVTLSGIIADSATVGAQDLIITNTSAIGRDLLGGIQNLTINGQIKRDLVAGSENLIVNGTVGRNVNGGTESLMIGSSGVISGNVEYISDKDLTISNGGKINGTVSRTAPEKSESSNSGFEFGWFIYFIITAIATSVVLVSLFPRIFEESSTKALKTPGKTFLLGLLTVFLAPVLIIALMISTVGIPLAIFITLAWIASMFINGAFAGYMVGRMIMKNTKQPALTMLAGVSALSVIYFIPAIGFIAFFTASLFGTGMIVMQIKKLAFKK